MSPMQFTLALLLIPYALFLILFAAFAFVNLFHIFRFGSFTLLSFAVTFLFLGGTAIILVGTYTLLSGTDWTQPLFVFRTSVFAPTF